MCKWIVKALTSGYSPLLMLLHHWLKGLRPPGQHGWPRSLQWALLSKFSASNGSLLWTQLVCAWRMLCPLVTSVPPISFEEVQNTHLWWNTHLREPNFGFTKAPACQLATQGLTCPRDLWVEESMELRTWDSLQWDYGLDDTERRRLIDLVQSNVLESRSRTRDGDLPVQAIQAKTWRMVRHFRRCSYLRPNTPLSGDQGVPPRSHVAVPAQLLTFQVTSTTRSLHELSSQCWTPSFFFGSVVRVRVCST